MLLYHHVKFTLGADPYSLLPQALARWNDLKRYHGWADLRVEYAELNYILSNALTPDDSQFGQLWGLNNTGQSGGTADGNINEGHGFGCLGRQYDVWTLGPHERHPAQHPGHVSFLRRD